MIEAADRKALGAAAAAAPATGAAQPIWRITDVHITALQVDRDYRAAFTTWFAAHDIDAWHVRDLAITATDDPQLGPRLEALVNAHDEDGMPTGRLDVITRPLISAPPEPAIGWNTR